MKCRNFAGCEVTVQSQNTNNVFLSQNFTNVICNVITQKKGKTLVHKCRKSESYLLLTEKT